MQLVRFLAALVFLVSVVTAHAAPAAKGWETPAEKCGYRCTPRLDETMRYLERLAAHSPLLQLSTIGETGRGRAMPLAILSKEKAFTPAAARALAKPVVLVQNAIHAGEMDGKDACLALLRDILVHGRHSGVLDAATILILPVYNADGHERFGPTHRINQNGPAETGFRGNAQRLDLNRDFMRADAPETRAWLRLFAAWRPELLLDCHTTDGADVQHDLTYIHSMWGTRPVEDWVSAQVLEPALARLRAQGHLPHPYLLTKDYGAGELEEGIWLEPTPARFGAGYMTLHNRSSILVEAHSLKDYRTRVVGTYDFLVALLEALARQPGRLVELVAAADRAELERAGRWDPADATPVLHELAPESRTTKLLGYAKEHPVSPITGEPAMIFTKTPKTYEIPLYDTYRPAKSVARPLAYVIPPEHADVAERLRNHGLTVARLRQPLTRRWQMYRLRDWKLDVVSQQGRVRSSFTPVPVVEEREFPAGSWVVALAQPGGRVAMGLLEPDSIDSLVAWGFFYAAGEQREYYEDYLLEPMAREMLARDPALAAEFAKRLEDPEFAKNARARLDFFYERTTYFDRDFQLYPVARVTEPIPAAMLE